jgi:hypothetical protein
MQKKWMEQRSREGHQNCSFKETYTITQNKMIQQGTRKIITERKELARN